MVEKYFVLPGNFVVTILANNSLFTFMWVVFGMTVIAGGLKFNFEYGFNMAVSTFNRFMSTD